MSQTTGQDEAPNNTTEACPGQDAWSGAAARSSPPPLPVWLVRTFAACLGIAVAGGIAYTRWSKDAEPAPRGEALAANSVQVDPAQRFKLRLHGSGWRKVEDGTHSKGGTEVEFELASSDAYVIVFASDQEKSLESHGSWRIERFLENATKAECSEQRVLQAGTLHVVSTIRCNGTTRSSRQLVKHYRSINADGSSVEVIGRSYVSAAEPHGADLINDIVASFEIP